MSTFSTDINYLSKGINTDYSPKSQPDGTYRDALNAVLESDTGQYPFITNEQGTIECWDFPAGHKIIGSVYMNNDEYVLFIQTTSSSEIGIYNKESCTYTALITESCLNFDSKYPIRALYRLKNGCDRTIYFTDNNNPYRIINLDNLSQYYVGGTFICDSIKLTRDVEIPIIDLESVNDSGGSLKVGTYQFTVHYLDEDLNPTVTVASTLPIPIVDENLSSDYTNIDGGVPVIDSNQAVGSVDTTTKSITLSLSNLDTTYPYYRIGIIESTATTGRASAVYLSDEIPINSSTDSFTYANNTNLIQTTIDELNVDPIEIDRVKAHTQLDNRLIIANLTNSTLDYALIQQQAELIDVTWVTKDVDKQSLNRPEGAAKSPYYYIDHRSFLRDEVYALGIKGKKKNGYSTPVFHIPGREALASDLVALSVGAGLDIEPEDARHLEPHGNSIPTWKIRNTADGTGRMAYYETNTPYPTTTDCNGVPIFPTGNVRHHKFPDLEISDFHDSTTIKPLGIKVDLTAFLAALPASITGEVAEWEIVVGKRDDVNRTIVDKGFTLNTFSGDSFSINSNEIFSASDRVILGNLVGTGTQTADLQERVYFSPKTMLTRKSIPHSFFNVEKEFSDSQVVLTPGYFTYSPDWSTATNENFNRVVEQHAYLDRYSGWDGRYFPIPITEYYLPVKQSINNINFANISFSVPFVGLSLQDDYSHLSTTGTVVINGSYISLKNNNEVHPNIGKIEYMSLGNSIESPTNIFTYYGGDIFLGYFGFKFMELNTLRGGTYVQSYFESEVNPELRHEGLIDPTLQSYYQFDETILEYMQATNRLNETGDEVIVSPDFMGYNQDYSKLPIERISFPLSNTYQYCNACEDKLPYTVYASEKSLQEDREDLYRTFLANNKGIIDNEFGEITDLFPYKNDLYINTEYQLYFQPTRPQTLQTNESVAYVGTGDIFSVPPRRIGTASTASGGSKYFLSRQITDNGIFWADPNSRNIYQLTDRLNSISHKGLKNWFHFNSPILLYDSIAELTGIKPTEISELEVGYISAYDNKLDRYILTKKDYKPTAALISVYRGVVDDSTSSAGMTTNGVYYGRDGYFANWVSPTVTAIPYSNTTYFENKSYTLSFSTPHQAWASYHSYIPDYYLTDETTFSSHKYNDPKIWEHNSGPMQTFYNTKNDHIIEFIVKSQGLQTRTFNAISIVCDTETYNPTYEQWSTNSDFFTRAIFYNSTQSSGKLTVLPITTTTVFNPVKNLNQNLIYAKRIENTWNLSDFRDRVTQGNTLPLFSTRWTDISPEFFSTKVINSSTLNLTKSQYTLSRFRDKWLGIRLFHNSETNTKINTNIISTQSRISIR